MRKTKKILILYSEIAGYTLSCLQHYSSTRNSKILLVKWPTNSEAPFVFNDFGNIKVIEKKEGSFELILDEVSKFYPDVIITSGWLDKDYLKICAKYKRNIPTVVSFDNHWVGSLKQILLKYVSSFTIKKYFNSVWVPGSPQEVYAKHLQFNSVYNGFYCCDTELYNECYSFSIEQKRKERPKTILYIGRYVTFKGIFEMWEAFKKISEKYPDWKLICVGTGEEFENRIKHPSIEHLGFLQPNELKEVIRDSSYCILPSHKEPWGVSVHEMTAAGLPMIVSEEIGAATQFVKEGQNGWIVPANNQSKLEEAMLSAIQQSFTDWIEWSEKSHNLAQSITLETWSQTLDEIIANNE